MRARAVLGKLTHEAIAGSPDLFAIESRHADKD